MTARQWPFPGDAAIVRARKVALAYRAHAQECEQVMRDILAAWEKAGAKPEDLPKMPQLDVDALDRKFRDWGEEWHAEIEIDYAPDDEVKARIAGPRIGINAHSISQLRIRGRIKGRWVKPPGENGHYLYKISDVDKLSTELRGRAWRAKDSTDTVTPDGGSDSE